MIHDLLYIIYYEMRETLDQAFTWLTPLLFFIIVVCLFPLACGPDPVLLTKMAPGIIWVAALLSIIISIGNLFRTDSEEGFLDLILLSHYPLSLLVFCKTISHWLTHCLPLVLISPLLGFLLHLSFQKECALVVTLLLGTPVLSLMGSIGAALTVGIRRHGLLLPILIMPFYIPVLIVGSATILAEAESVSGYYAMMGAFMLLSMAFAPFLTGAALRIGVTQ